MTFLPPDRGLPVGRALEMAKHSDGAQKIASQKRIAKRNWHRIFSTIVVVDGPSARDIAEITGLAQGTVTGVLEQLKSKKLIKTVDPDEEGGGRGRRPRTIRVNPEGLYVVGVEITPEELTGVVVDLRGEPVGRPRSLSLPAQEVVDPDHVVDGVRDLVEELRKGLGEHRGEEESTILGLGVEVGGHIDARRGTVVFSPNLGWTDPVPLRQRLRDATRLYTVLENDVNALGNAQKWFGAARMLESFSIVLVSYDGIGSAKFWDEELVHGSTGKAGELGHYWIERNGPKCRCGKRGCVEALATGPAILNSLGGSWEQAQERAAEGDREAVRAFAAAGDALGRGLSIMLTENDPGSVIFTGNAVSDSRRQPDTLVLHNDHYHDAMWDAVVEHTFGGTPPAAEDFVVIEDEQNWNGPRGAATTVIGDIITATVEI